EPGRCGHTRAGTGWHDALVPIWARRWRDAHDDVRRGRVCVLHGCGSQRVTGKPRSGQVHRHRPEPWAALPTPATLTSGPAAWQPGGGSGRTRPLHVTGPALRSSETSRSLQPARQVEPKHVKENAMDNQIRPYEPLTSENAALVLVDHQVGLMTGVRDYSTGELKHNVVALAKAAKALTLPVIVTTTAR